MQSALILLLFVSSFWPVKLAEPEPRVIFRFRVDHLLVDMSKGAPAAGKTLRIEYKLADNSEQLFPDLKQQPIQVKGLVSLARNGRRIGTIAWYFNKKFPLTIYNAAPGDRLVIEVQAIKIRLTDGSWLSVSEKAMPVYNIPLF